MTTRMSWFEEFDGWRKHAPALEDQVWTQRWRRGDLLIWDNRSVMH